MRILAVLLITYLSISVVFAQIEFEDGYFITDDGLRVSCQIQNEDWRFNPKEFTYLGNDGITKKIATIEDVQEFGILDYSKYVRKDVNIDRSSEKLSELSSHFNPDYHEETLFLEVLVEGEATLYQYLENSLERFFYTVNEQEINQLVYKNYSVNGNNVRTNNSYQQQLKNHMTCASQTVDPYNLSYSKNSLLK